MDLQVHHSLADSIRKSWAGLLLIWVIIFLLFSILYIISRRVVINEIRHHVMGVAIAAAAGIDPKDIERIHSPEDMNDKAFQGVQSFMEHIADLNPDVRYIYTMRRSLAEGMQPNHYEYVVDYPEKDRNGNGVIDPDESSNPPGTPYDASAWPELVQSWYRPGADPEVSPDPPYPDLMSGYAPVIDDTGKTVAVVGVDITAQTVRKKLLALRIVIFAVWLVLSLMSAVVAHYYYHQRRLLTEREDLIGQLTDALGKVKTLSGLLPICSSCNRIHDDKGGWKPIEVYISGHSEAEFTHGICPDCLKKLYPEQYKRMVKNGLKI